MRQALTTTLVGAALVLAGCSGDGDGDGAAPGTTAPGDPTVSTAGEDTDAGGTAPVDGSASTDGAPSTADAPPAADGVEGGEDGQAAADVAKAFLLTMVDADPKACDYLLSFTDIQRPMTEVESDYDMCVELLPEVLAAETQAQGLDADAVEALENLQITGADVQEDTAVVDADNYGDEFAESMGDTKITLKKIGGQWYVDLDHSFATATSR